MHESMFFLSHYSTLKNILFQKLCPVLWGLRLIIYGPCAQEVDVTSAEELI